SNGQAASLVIGQSGFTTNAAPNPPTATSLNSPTQISFDSSGNLWNTDSANSRVLKYTTPFSNGEAASIVIGQSSLTTNTAPNPPTVSSLNNPTAVIFDPLG